MLGDWEKTEGKSAAGEGRGFLLGDGVTEGKRCFRTSGVAPAKS